MARVRSTEFHKVDQVPSDLLLTSSIDAGKKCILSWIIDRRFAFYSFYSTKYFVSHSNIHVFVCPAFSKKWTRAFGNDDDDDIDDEYGEEWSARSAGKRAETRSQLLQRAKRIVSWIVRREENIVHIVLLQSTVLGDPVSLSMVHFISFEYFDIQLGFSKLRIVALASERRVFFDNGYSLTS